jgi:hypothetical protein
VSINLPYDEVDLAAAQKKYELRYKRTEGSADRYQATYSFRVRTKPNRSGYLVQHRAGLEIDEDITAELILYHTGKTDGAGEFDRVVFRRRDEERKRLEVSPNGKVKQDKSLKDFFQPKISPNFEREPKMARDGRIYTPMNSLGCIPTRAEHAYHYAWDDSLCYMFPVFPKGAVGTGDSWEYKFPVIVGREFANNVFTVTSTFKLTDIRRISATGGRDGPLCAVIEYKYYGFLDSAISKDLPVLADNQPGLLWRRDVVEGDGKVYFDIEAGKVRWRKESYRLDVERDTRQPSSAKKKERPDMREIDLRKPARGYETVPYRSRIKVTFACRALSPGERAADRPSRLDR